MTDAGLKWTLWAPAGGDLVEDVSLCDCDCEGNLLSPFKLFECLRNCRTRQN